MEKVSVATRCPFMKTPNDPESTICATGALSSLPDAAANTVSTHNVETVLNTKRVRFDVHVFIPAPNSMPPPLQLFPHLCRRFQCGPSPSYRTAAGFHIVREIA